MSTEDVYLAPFTHNVEQTAKQKQQRDQKTKLVTLRAVPPRFAEGTAYFLSFYQITLSDLSPPSETGQRTDREAIIPWLGI